MKIHEQEKVFFGIGCLHFGLSGQPPYSFAVDKYISDIRALLESISNVNNVDIEYDARHFEPPDVIDTKLPRLKEGECCFPLLPHCEIKFDLYIPNRIQADLLEEKAKHLATGTENFRVYFFHKRFCPVVFVECVKADNNCSPSDSVVLVRRFMENELDGKNSDLQLETLGPSPFHTDCIITTADNETREIIDISCEIITSRGYDTIRFHINPAVFDNIHEAKDYLFHHASYELSFYYSLVSDSVLAINQWFELTKIIQNLIDIQKTTGIKGKMKQLFRQGRHVNDLFTEAAEFKISLLLQKSSSDETYSRIYGSSEPSFFKPYIDKEREMQVNYPVNEITSLGSFFETRRTKSLEMFVILISAILGGIIGSTLTLLFSK